jgi:hypothetical protein
LLAAGVFVAAFLSRTVWLSHAYFHPDESTVLWMALDAVRHPSLPDHGLVSSYVAFQPPGLVWVTMPFVAVGGGRPDFVITGFGLLNAAAITFLAATVADAWGFVQAVVLSAFLVVGPDAFVSSWTWHISLYTGAFALLLAAGIRLRTGSTWWSAIVVAIPGLYALIHYSGFVLFGPALVLLLFSRRRWIDLVAPLAAGLSCTALAWVPFLLFEERRDWSDLSTISGSADPASTLHAKLVERYYGARFALDHLGQGARGVDAGWHSAVLLTPIIVGGAIAALLLAVLKRSTDRAVVVPTAVLATGLAIQVASNEGNRTDILMLWLVPLYALCGWTAAQACTFIAGRLSGREAHAAVAGITTAVVVSVLAIGGIDLERAVGSTLPSHTLSHELAAARTHSPVHYQQTTGRVINSYYLPCDPPYDWGSETWYLEEEMHPGTGIQAAIAARAFVGRRGSCSSWTHSSASDSQRHLADRRD